MNALLVFVFLLAAAVAGYAVVRLCSAGLTPAETLAWSFAAGLLVQATTVLILLAARMIPGPKKILAAEALLLAASFAWRRRPKPPPRASAPTHGPKWIRATLLGLVCAGVFLFLALALSGPMDATDFLAIWGLKGRMIFASGRIPAGLFHDPALQWAHPEYPLLIPLSFAALASAIRTWDDRALALLYPFCQAGTLVALWGFLSRRVSTEAGAAAAALAALCLPLYSWGNVGTAEIPMALAFVLAASAAIDAREEKSRDAYARLGLTSLFCAAVKQEGMLFVLLLAATLLLLDRRRGFVAAAVAVLPGLAHGLLLRVLRGPVLRRDYDLTLLEPYRWEELAARAAIVARHLVTVELAHTALALVAIAAFLAVTRRGVADWLAIPLAVQVLAYVALCTLCAFGPLWLLQASFSRVGLALVPISVLVFTARLSRTGDRDT